MNPMPGSNIPMATLGTFILWMGWFGFNGGSVLSLGSAGSAIEMSNVFVNTNLAACGGMIAAMIVVQAIYKKVDVTMALNGALAGLVSITAGPATPSPGAAILIGAVGGVLVVFAVPFFDKLKIDDVVGALSVHLVCGIWGTLAVPITNSDANFTTQLIGVLAIGAFVIVASSLTWLVLKYTVGHPLLGRRRIPRSRSGRNRPGGLPGFPADHHRWLRFHAPVWQPAAVPAAAATRVASQS